MSRACLVLFCLFTMVRAFGDEAVTPPDPSLEVQNRLVTVGIEDYNRRIDSKFALFVHHRTFLIPYSYIHNPSNDIYEPIKAVESNSHDFYSNQEAQR